MSSAGTAVRDDVQRPVEKHRGWPKGKKRKPASIKDENAPRRPVNGYVRYMTEKREEVTLQNPTLSFADVTKILGNNWSSLPQDQKQKYLDVAESEKAEYLVKLKNYQEKQQFKQQKLDIKDAASGSRINLQAKRSKTPVAMNDSDIPIFTEAFLDHNKAKDAELRQLKKSNSEYNEQNTILQRHIQSLQNAITRLDNETQTQRQSNYRLQVKLHNMRETIVRVFKDLPLPENGMLPTMKTVDLYMKQVHFLLQNTPEKYQEFASAVQEIMLKLNKNEVLFLKT